MFRCKTFLVVLFCMLLFMHSLMILVSVQTIKNGKLNITDSKNRSKRAVSVISYDRLWDDGIIRYEMVSDLEPHRCLIESAMMHIMLQSCVLFRPNEQNEHFIPILYIEKGKVKKCSATMGADRYTFSGSLFINSDHCYNFGVILHELMHVLGFDHEHQRSDRDHYLQINYENIKNDDLILQYEKIHWLSESYLPQFDFDSITMYGNVSASKDRKLKTIESKVPGKLIVDATDKLSLSRLDVKSINELYKCPFEDNKACDKLTLLDGYIANCSVEARRYIKLSLIKKLIDQCK